MPRPPRPGDNFWKPLVYVCALAHARLYKSLCAAVNICFTLGNIQAHIHTQTYSMVTSLREKRSRSIAELKETRQSAT